MKKWNHVMRDARLTYLHRDEFAYLYGANGEKPMSYAEAKYLVDELWGMYPTHFEEYVINRGYTKKQLIYHIIGKKCFDCSAFVCAVTQYEGDFRDMVVLKDYSSFSLRQQMNNETTPLDGTWGNVLWKSGHVGIDVANGFVVDFGAEFADCRMYRIQDEEAPKFEVSGQLPWVDYTGASNL